MQRWVRTRVLEGSRCPNPHLLQMRKLRHTEVKYVSQGYMQETSLTGHLRPVHSGYSHGCCKQIGDLLYLK